ncbi:MAG TPA: TIGR03435 family protein [Desulfuromonadaceae bacterium]|nr:TIGR03435 family protein [Desulfuromonadaceae bacterium]
MTQKTILGLVAAFIVIASAIAVKVIWFPSVKEAWFQANGQRLLKVPEGLVIVRPTHFPGPKTNIVTYARKGNSLQWMSGRNVTFKRLMADAYVYDPNRVWLPEGTPKDNYDFLFTPKAVSREPLQAAVRKKTGYIAKVENHETDVIALKVIDPSSQGLKVSGDNERAGVGPKGGRLYFTHQHLSAIVEGLTDILKQPVVDKTDLTNFYDFSLVWDSKTQQQIQRGELDPETGKKILEEWGLGLEPDRASIEMLVVKKTN